MNTITHEFTNFNADHLAKLSEADFLKEFENTPVYADYSAVDRKKLLKEAYAKCLETVKKSDKPAETPVPVK